MSTKTIWLQTLHGQVKFSYLCGFLIVHVQVYIKVKINYISQLIHLNKQCFAECSFFFNKYPSII